MLDALLAEYNAGREHDLRRDATLLAQVGQFFQRLWTPGNKKVSKPFTAEDFLPSDFDPPPEKPKVNKLTDRQHLVYMQMVLATGKAN